MGLYFVSINAYKIFQQDIQHNFRISTGFTNRRWKRIRTLAKPRPLKMVIWHFIWLEPVNKNVYTKFGRNMPFSLTGPVSLFHNLTSVKPRSMKKSIWQNPELHLINMNPSMKFHGLFYMVSRIMATFC